MPRLLVFQHVPFEILGTLNPLFKRSGFRIRYVNFGRHPDAQPSLEGYDGLVVLGGPMSVSETRKHPHLTTELRVIEEAIAKRVTLVEIIPGKGSGQLKKKVLRFLQQSHIKSQYHRIEKDSKNFGRLFVHFRFK